MILIKRSCNNRGKKNENREFDGDCRTDGGVVVVRCQNPLEAKEAYVAMGSKWA